MKLKFLSVFVVLFVNTAIAQITAIPDPAFEQALIDLGIDSDGVVNGQVLTADIEHIIELDFENVLSYAWIADLTGIQGFVNLEVLNLNGEFAGVDIFENQANIFTDNINLRELSITNPCGDCATSFIISLNLSGLPNLELIDLQNVQIQTLKLNNTDFNLSNLTINLEHEGFPGNDFTQQICIEVNDPQAATNNQPPYNTWNIIYNEFTTSIGFGENCTLSIANYENFNSISVYPNPVKDVLWIENPNQIQLKSVNVFTMQGKLVKTFADVKDNLSLSELKSGLYFVKINDSTSFKIVKQ